MTTPLPLAWLAIRLYPPPMGASAKRWFVPPVLDQRMIAASFARLGLFTSSTWLLPVMVTVVPGRDDRGLGQLDHMAAGTLSVSPARMILLVRVRLVEPSVVTSACQEESG